MDHDWRFVIEVSFLFYKKNFIKNKLELSSDDFVYLKKSFIIN